jgi:hypothetical protein
MMKPLKEILTEGRENRRTVEKKEKKLKQKAEQKIKGESLTKKRRTSKKTVNKQNFPILLGPRVVTPPPIQPSDIFQ